MVQGDDVSVDPKIACLWGAILTVSAVSATATAGIILLGVYSLGLGLPFLAAAAFTDALIRRRKALGRAGRLLRGAAGAIMIAMGVAMITGAMTTFSFWLLENVPMLSRIGSGDEIYVANCRDAWCRNGNVSRSIAGRKAMADRSARMHRRWS